MGLDIWFKDDIVNILRAANEANLSALVAGNYASGMGMAGEAGTELRLAYRRGFVAALATLAQALGLPVTELDRQLAVAAPETGGGGWGRGLALPAVRLGGQRWEK
jgi:hypothetical protein